MQVLREQSVSVVLVGLGLACGPALDGGSGSGASGVSDTAANSGTSTVGATQAGDGSASAGDGGSASAGGSGDTGGGSCDPSDPQIGPAVDVRISNNGDAPLYLVNTAQCAEVPPFTVSFDGAPVTFTVEACTSCANALEDLCLCPQACVADSVIRVDPGGTWEGQWSGAVAYTADLTPPCANDLCNSCVALSQAQAGTYVIAATAFTDIGCEARGCYCTPSADPAATWCTIWGEPSGEQTAIQVALEYPAQTAVDLAFP